MKILAVDRLLPGATLDKIQPLLKEEAQHAYALYQRGVFRELYFRADHPGAAVILECADVTEARAVLATLPLVKAGLIEFEIIPLAAFPFENAFK